MDIFYYDKKQLLMLCAFNVLLLALIILTEHYYPVYGGICAFVAMLCFISICASVYVTIFPHKLAQISDQGIIIDQHHLLKWQDIKNAKKLRPSKFSLRTIIVFELYNNSVYPLSLMQKICEKSPYGAFSIPLYAMTKKDRMEIENKISIYIKIT